MFKGLAKIAAGLRIYHHSQHVNRSNAYKASGESDFSYDDLKTLRKFTFWLFILCIFLNWSVVAGFFLTAWIVMWVVSIFF